MSLIHGENVMFGLNFAFDDNKIFELSCKDFTLIKGGLNGSSL